MRVSSDITRLDIAPGSTAELPLDVINTGLVIDGITARMVGLPDEQVTSRPALLPLFPDSSGQITLALTIPPTFPAGRHPMTAEVSSRQDGTEPGYVNVDVTVPLAPALTVTSKPELVRSKRTGRFILTVTNRGNALLDIGVAVTDPQKTCTATVEPGSLSLGPGAAAEAVVTVRGRRMWTGSENDHALTAVVTGRPVNPATGADLVGGAGALGGVGADAATDAGSGADVLNGAGVGALDGAPNGRARVGSADGFDAEGEDPDAESPAVEPITAQARLTFRQRPLLTRGVITALILVLIVALWAAVFLFGLSKVFAGDPMTKSAPASFFAATKQQQGNGSGGGAPAGALPKSGTLPAGVGGTVSGAVKADSSGQPVGRILVTAERIKADGSVVKESSAATQSDGSYEVSGLFPGQYLLAFSGKGFDSSYYPAATSLAKATPLAVSSGKVTTAKTATVTGKPATITGKVDPGDVTGTVTTTITARLLQQGSGGAGTVQAAKTSDNQYTIKDLPAPGTYELTFTTKGYDQSTLRATVTGGAQRYESTVVLSAGLATVSGMVTDGTDPVGGATIATTVDGKKLTTGTPTQGSVGHFLLNELPTPGNYVITASKDGYGSVSQVIDLAPGEASKKVSLTLQAGTGVIQGTLVDSEGKGLGDATVTVGGLSDAPKTVTLTEGDVGSFRLAGLPTPGSYTLTFSLDGYADESVPITLEADKAHPPIKPVMSASTGSITGVVTGTNGKGAPDATITATNGQRSWPVISTTDSSSGPVGSYTIGNLPSGSYTVTAADSADHEQTKLVTVSPGTPASLNFRLRGGG